MCAAAQVVAVSCFLTGIAMVFQLSADCSARAVVGTALKSCLVLLASPVTMCQNNYTAFVSVSIDDSMRCNNNHSDKFVLNESDFSSTGGSLTLLPVAAPVIVAQNQPEWSSTVTVKTALAASLVPNVVAGLAGAGGFLLVMCVSLVLCNHRVLGAVFAAIAVAVGTTASSMPLKPPSSHASCFQREVLHTSSSNSTRTS